MSDSGNHVVVVTNGISVDGVTLPGSSAVIASMTQVDPKMAVPYDTVAYTIPGLVGLTVSEIATIQMYTSTMDCVVTITGSSGSVTFSTGGLSGKVAAGSPYTWNNIFGGSNPLTAIGTAITAATVKNNATVGGVASSLTTTNFSMDIELLPTS